MNSLLFATVFFLTSHLALSRAATRQALVRRVGEMAYLGIYSLLALVGIVWMVMAIRHTLEGLSWAPLGPLHQTR